MDGIYEYITNPANIISFVVFVFGLGATWSKLNGKINNCEKRLEKIEEADLETKLAEIKTDLEWIKRELAKLNK